MTIDRNKNRPGYKETKVGWIPEEWESIQLGAAFNKSSEKGKESYPVLSVTMDRGLIERSEMDRQMAPDLPPDQSLRVARGDIVYNMMRMWQGSVGLCQKEGLVSPAYVVCKPKQETCPKFFFYLFKSHAGLYRLWAYSYGITGDRLRLYYQDFAKVPSPLPPLSEQEAIAEVLGCWDEGLETIEKLIDAKKLRKKGLMQKLLTGEKRLPGFSNDWKEVRLGDVFTKRTIKNHPDKPVLSVTQDDGVVLRNSLDRKIQMDNANTHTYKLVKEGDFIISLRSFQGGLEYSTVEGLVSPAYHVIYPTIKINDLYFKHFFKSYWFIAHLDIAIIGIRDGKQVSFGDFTFLPMDLPPVDEQKAIAAVLETADEEIRLLEAERDALADQKKGLMQKLLTGEVRCPEYRTAC